VFTDFQNAGYFRSRTRRRRPVPQANWVNTIHHGLPENLLTPHRRGKTTAPCSAAFAPGKGGSARHQDRHALLDFR